MQNDIQFRFLSPTQKDELYEVISDRISDLIWDEHFYIFEFFDTTTGFTVSSSSGSVSFVKGVDLITGTSSGNFKHFGRKVPNQANNTLITVGRETRFRTSVVLGETTNQTGYIRTLNNGGYGSIASLGDSVFKDSSIGFKIEDGTILACTQNLGAESTTPIHTIVPDVPVRLELRYFPRERVDYYVNGAYQASLTKNLPTQSDTLSFFDAYLQTDEAAQKDMYVEYYEFLQKRK